MAYFERKVNPLDPIQVKCDPCGHRHHYPNGGDPDADEGWNPQGDWCWAPRWSMTPTLCDGECGGYVDR